MIRNIDRENIYLSRGSGVGSIFSSIFRGLIPLARGLFSVGKTIAKSDTGQKVLKAAKRTALDTGLDLAHDTLSGKKKFKEAVKSRLNFKQLASKFDDNVKKSFTGGKKSVMKKRKYNKKKTKISKKKQKRNWSKKTLKKSRKKNKKYKKKNTRMRRGQKVKFNRKQLLDMWI